MKIKLSKTIYNTNIYGDNYNLCDLIYNINIGK